MEEMFTKQETKELAIKYMKELKLPKQIIDTFDKNDAILCYDPVLQLWGTVPTYILDKIVTKYQTPYVCTYLKTDFGRMWNFLIVSRYKDDLEFNLERHGLSPHYNALAFVVNEDEPILSEGGTIEVVRLIDGGLLRNDL